MEHKKGRVALLLKMVVGVVFTEAAGMFSAWFSGNIPAVFASQIHPPLTPPAFVFGIVWMLLYALMGIAFGIVWHADTSRKGKAYVAYFLQLVLNIIWSPLFFRYRAGVLSIIVILLLWVSVLLCMRIFCKIRKVAGYLLLPYLLWITFATYLNIATVYLNGYK